MIDYARAPLDPSAATLCDVYPPAPSARLDDFQVFKKGAYIYGNYYSYNSYECAEPEEADAAAAVYHSLVNARDCPPREEWRQRLVAEWAEEDTVAWLVDAAQAMGCSEYEVPYYNFRVAGAELRAMSREEVQRRLLHPHVDPALSRRIADTVFERLHCRLSEEMFRQAAAPQPQPQPRYPEGDPFAHDPAQTVLDLDSLEHKHRLYGAAEYGPHEGLLLGGGGACDSSDEDAFRQSESASPVLSYGSDGSKSGDDEDKKKMFKRPPGRPKGSGRKVCKRPRSVSVPEFLRDMLLDPKYCPSIIKWEDYLQGKFRFVKPDEVAKLWGKQKQNDGMTFEKFSRAMRYHYRQSVLVSVPTARLVYQFGPKGPDYNTHNPNFLKLKPDPERGDSHHHS